MKALIQRVKKASVIIYPQEIKREIGHGLVVFLGVGNSDRQPNEFVGKKKADKLAQKIANLRVFSNKEGKFDKSLLDVGGECLVISQFTLYADASKGRRPDFTAAAPPVAALPLYRHFIQELKKLGVKKVEEGEFQAHMEVNLINDGPVTLLLEA